MLQKLLYFQKLITNSIQKAKNARVIFFPFNYTIDLHINSIITEKEKKKTDTETCGIEYKNINEPTKPLSPDFHQFAKHIEKCH